MKVFATTYVSNLSIQLRLTTYFTPLTKPLVTNILKHHSWPIYWAKITIESLKTNVSSVPK